MELEGIELADLLEGASEILEEKSEKLTEAVFEAFEQGMEKAVESAQAFGEALLEQGTESVESFLSSALEMLEDSGSLEELKTLLEGSNQLLENLNAGVERLIELPTEELLPIIALIAIACIEPTLLLENPQIVEALLSIRSKPQLEQ